MKLGDRLAVVADVLVVLLVLLVGGFVVKQQFLRKIPSTVADAQDIPARNWRNWLVEGTRIGDRSAPLQIVVFSDFKCAHCKALYMSLDSLLTRYPSSIAVSYQHVPQKASRESYALALAAECAAEQGVVRPFFTSVFGSEILAWNRDELLALAHSLNVPKLKDYSQCLDSFKYAGRIDSSLALAVEIGLRGTPTSFVNGELLVGALPAAEFERRLQQVLGPR